MAKVKITVRPNGPYRVEDPEGLVELVDANGVPYPLPREIGGQAVDLPVPLRSQRQQTFLRRNSLADRLPGRRSGGARGAGKPAEKPE